MLSSEAGAGRVNMMRYIYGKDLDAKMLETLLAELMKHKIDLAKLDIQIGGKVYIIEYLVLIKTRRLITGVVSSRASIWRV